jgi:hypothetical protein
LFFSLLICVCYDFFRCLFDLVFFFQELLLRFAGLLGILDNVSGFGGLDITGIYKPKRALQEQQG